MVALIGFSLWQSVIITWREIGNMKSYKNLQYMTHFHKVYNLRDIVWL